MTASAVSGRNVQRLLQERLSLAERARFASRRASSTASWPR